MKYWFSDWIRKAKCEKFLEQSLQFHGFKLNVDYTKQKHEDVYNLEDDKSEITKPDIVLRRNQPTMNTIINEK